MSDIKLSNLTIGYQQKALIEALSLSIQAGTLLAIVGANGCGKSTLLRTLIGELKPLSGTIDFENYQQSDIAYLPQRHHIDQRFPINVQDFVAMGLWRHIGAFAHTSKPLRAQLQEVLNKVGLKEHKHKPLAKLSGGQLQRALFARLLLQDARIILLDEPFNAIDQATTHDLLQLLKEWQQQERIVLCVLHDWQQVAQHFPHTLWLQAQENRYGPTEQILQRAQQKVA